MAESLYDVLFEQSVDGIIIQDADQILRVNSAFCQLHGYTAQELIGRSSLELLHPEDREAAQTRMDELLERGGSLPMHTYRALHQDGTQFWVQATSQVVERDEGPVLQTIARDLTKAEHSERALELSERRYRGLFDSLPIGLYRTTPEGRIMDVNPALVEMLGYPDRETLLAIQVETGYADAEARRAWCEHIEREGTIRGHETQWKRYDDTPIWIEESTRAVRDESGRVKYYEGSAQDISDRKSTEEALVREKALFEQLFDVAPEAVVLCDASSTILRANAEFARLFGHPIDTVIGKNIDRLLTNPSQAVQAEAKSLTQDVATGETVSAETQRFCRDGTPVEVSVLGHPIRVNEQQIGVYGIYRDITERKQMERALEREKALFEQLFSGAPEAVVLCDADMKILRTNAEFSNLFGYTNEEALSEDLDELITPRGQAERQEALDITDSVKRGKLTALESRRRRKDGELIDVSILAQPIAVDGVQVGNYGIYRDITDRKEAERALSEAHTKVELLHEAAEKLEKAKTEDEVYEITIDSAEQVLGFPRCAIDAVEDGMLVAKALSSGTPSARNRTCPIEQAGVAGAALQSQLGTILDPPPSDALAEVSDDSIKCLVTQPIREYGVFQAASPVPHAFEDADVKFLRILLGHTTEAIARLRLEQKLKDQATRDPLTGVFNRRHFNEVIEGEVRRAKRYDHPLGLLMVDVDKFKHINDYFGHQAGDMVLQAISKILRDTVRGTDFIVRYGGDEFLIVLTETDEESVEVAERIRTTVAGTRVIAGNASIPISISIGTAEWHPGSGSSVEAALAQADEQMYENKRAG